MLNNNIRHGIIIYVFQGSRPKDGNVSVELASSADWIDSDAELDGEEESPNNSASEASSRPSALNCCKCGGTSPVLSPVR